MRRRSVMTGIALSLIALLPCSNAAAAHHEKTEEAVGIEKRHQIQRECENLVYEFLRLFENEHAKAADLFTEDGEASFSAAADPTVGRDKIREAWSGIDSGKVELNALVANNLLVKVVNENNATAFCYVTHYQHRYKDAKREGDSVQTKGSPLMSWTFEFKPEDGKWKISRTAVRGYYTTKE